MMLIRQFDSLIFNFFNHQIATDWLDALMPVITQFGNGWCFGILALLLLRKTFIRENLPKYIGAFTGLAIGGGINAALKYDMARPRPYLSAGYLGEPARIIGEILTKNSFPSGHTFTAFAIASLIASFRPKLAIPVYLLASLVGLSRMYLGVHFPTDVLVGALLGILFVWVGVIVSAKVEKSKNCQTDTDIRK